MSNGILLICPECKAEITYSTKILVCKKCGCGPIDPVLAERVLIDDKIKELLLACDPIFQGVLFSYLGLFRSYNKEGNPNPLRANTVLRLMREVRDLYGKGWVRHTKKHQDLFTRPADFAAGMERMLAYVPRNLPLSDHNYLRNVVWGIAEEQGASAESAHREQEATGHINPVQPVQHRKDKYASAYEASHGKGSLDELTCRVNIAKIKKQAVAGLGGLAMEKVFSGKSVSEQPRGRSYSTKQLNDFLSTLTQPEKVLFLEIDNEAQGKIMFLPLAERAAEVRRYAI